MKDIARRRPVDRTAARVTAEGPKGYESSKRILTDFSEAPLPMRKIPRDAPKLVGVVCGWLTVIGMAQKRSSNGALWVCRCVCGYYTTRRSESIRNPRNAAVDRCDRCREVQFLKRRSLRQQLGYNPDEIAVGEREGSRP